ncbi:MAG: adenosylcobinamide-GDP ribazoletransferase [Ignavibacteria bacterium]|jgi:adenosylcobinamide-GDP ribazoletransferase|nr:adenosylcobinamide-GDP ribazoletransferase [Ignavibacteria bacterium]
MKKQLNIFLIALMFYSRILSPIKVEHSPENLNKATRYFPLIGWIIGLASFVIFLLSQYILPIEISVVISLVAGVLLTGAFHEDGFADMIDGFGGGWTSEKILEIMKDSRIGNYGAISLILLFLLKFYALLYASKYMLNQTIIELALLFISYHSLARLSATQLIFFSNYAREDEKSKVKPIGHFNSLNDAIIAYIFGLIPLVGLCFYNWQNIFVLLPILILVIYFKRYFEKWIGGYTGDCLGALEQISECTILLTYLVIWKFM